MSQQTVSAGGATEMAAEDAASAKEAKNDAKITSALGEYLRRYVPQGQEVQRDTLKDRYRIDLNQPLPDYDSKTARGYSATDTVEPSRQIIALVCNPGTVQRHRAINQLKTITNPAMATLVEAGVVELSRPEEERFVIFYERPQGKKLSELLGALKGQISQSFICDYIIAPLAGAINQFSELDISHGCINPDNIYFNNGAMLGPCVSEACGFGQVFYFEPVERMQALPAGKGEGTTEHDFYALAVLVLYILHGRDHFANFTPIVLARSILHDGVYAALTRQKDVPEMFDDFFRGLLSQSADDRWSYRHIKPWLSGKRYNVLAPPSPAEAIRPFDFGNTEATTRRELAHLFATNWEHILAAVQSNKLAHWASVSLRNKELAEGVVRIGRIVQELGGKNDLQTNEQLMRFVLLLDPQGPIRIKQLAFNIDGMDALCLELYITKAHPDLQLLAKFIEFNMASYWLDTQRKMQRKIQGEHQFPQIINASVLRLDRLRSCIRNTGFGFGLERMVYDLNPGMSCMSPLFSNSHVTTLPMLLKKLDKLSPTLFAKEDPIDRHIAAFIASRLGIQHEIRLHDLAAMPVLADSRSIMALYLLSMAQQKSGGVHLPGLTRWLGLRILPLMDNINSRTLRNKFKSLLNQQAQSGYTGLMAEVIINPDYVTTDQNGFHHAYQVYHNNADKIKSYREATYIDRQSARMGFVMAKFVAYASIVLSVLIVFKDVVL
jgi:hypothetical protein